MKSFLFSFDGYYFVVRVDGSVEIRVPEGKKYVKIAEGNMTPVEKDQPLYYAEAEMINFVHDDYKEFD